MKSSTFWDIRPWSPLTINGINGVISQEINLFVTTAVRTTDLININSIKNFIYFHA
jgi:hypothetical protein